MDTDRLYPAAPPDAPVAPGETLWELIQEKNLHLARVMTVTGLRPGELQRLILGHKRVTPDLSRGLEEATGTPARLWLRMQEEYDKTLARLRGQPGKTGTGDE